MNKRLLALTLVGATLATAACAPTTRFEWGNYEHALYAYSQNPEHRETYKESLIKTIAAGASRNAVAPGLHAELGYLYLEEGDTAQALTNFEAERNLFPESSAFMTRIIRQISEGQAG